MSVVISRCARQFAIGHKFREQRMADGVEMCIPWFKWIYAGNGRLQEFRIRFPITDSHLGETLRQQRCERMISGQMLFDTRLVRDEDYDKFRMVCFDRLLQLF